MHSFFISKKKSTEKNGKSTMVIAEAIMDQTQSDPAIMDQTQSVPAIRDQTQSVPLSYKEYFEQFDEGVNRDAIPRFVEGNRIIVFITAFYHVLAPYPLTFVSDDKSDDVASCTLGKARDEVHGMAQLPQLGDRDVPLKQLKNFFDTLVEVMDSSSIVYCIRNILQGGRLRKPSFVGGVAATAEKRPRYMVDGGSGGFRFCNVETGAYVTEKYAVPVNFTQPEYENYVSGLVEYAEKHLPGEPKESIPIRLTGAWRTLDEELLNYLISMLIAAGFTDVMLLSSTDEGFMEAASAAAIIEADKPAIVFASGRASTQTTEKQILQQR